MFSGEAIHFDRDLAKKKALAELVERYFLGSIIRRRKFHGAAAHNNAKVAIANSILEAIEREIIISFYLTKKLSNR